MSLSDSIGLWVNALLAIAFVSTLMTNSNIETQMLNIGAITSGELTARSLGKQSNSHYTYSPELLFATMVVPLVMFIFVFSNIIGILATETYSFNVSIFLFLMWIGFHIEALFNNDKVNKVLNHLQNFGA